MSFIRGRKAFFIAIVALCGAIVPGAHGAERAPVKSLLEIRQDKVVIQKWDLSCGAAVLATLLAYQHGDPVPEQQVAKGLMRRKEYIENPALVRKREGFSLLDMMRFVETRGYRGTGYGKLTLEALQEYAPIVVPLNLNGYNHFVVYRGRLGDSVLLADPAWGNRTMSVERFEKAWIDYPEIGKVGLVVSRQDGGGPPNQLLPRTSDFLVLR
jgi:predicted double-glycine peptidase